MEDNVFDAFDDQEGEVTIAPSAPTGSNPFDQWDNEPAPQPTAPVASVAPAPSLASEPSGITAIPGVSFTDDPELDGLLSELDARNKKESKDALDKARGDGFWEGVSDPQQYAEVAKGVVPGAVRFAGTTAKGGAAIQTAPFAAYDKVLHSRLERMNRIDAGERIKDINDVYGAFYQRASVADRKVLREELERQIAGYNYTPAEERSLYQAGEAVTEFSKGILPAAPGYEDAVGRQLGEGLGSLVAGLPMGFLGRVPAAVFFGAGGSGEALERSIEFDKREKAAGRAGLTEEQKIMSALWGVAPGTTDMLPVEMLLGRLKIPMPFRSKLASAIGRIGGQAFTEGFQEGGQGFLQNVIAQEIYNPEQRLTEGIVPGAGLGAGVGAIAATGKEIISSFGGRRSGRSSSGAPTPAPVEPAAPPQTLEEAVQRIDAERQVIIEEAAQAPQEAAGAPVAEAAPEVAEGEVLPPEASVEDAEVEFEAALKETIRTEFDTYLALEEQLASIPEDQSPPEGLISDLMDAEDALVENFRIAGLPGDSIEAGPQPVNSVEDIKRAFERATPEEIEGYWLSRRVDTLEATVAQVVQSPEVAAAAARIAPSIVPSMQQDLFRAAWSDSIQDLNFLVTGQMQNQVGAIEERPVFDRRRDQFTGEPRAIVDRLEGNIRDVVAAYQAGDKPNALAALNTAVEAAQTLRAAVASDETLRPIANLLTQDILGAARKHIFDFGKPKPETVEAPAAAANLRQSFAAALDSKTPLSKVATSLGVTEEDLAPFVEEAVQKGWLRKDASGKIRRAPKTARTGNIAALAIADAAPDAVPGEGNVAKTSAAADRWDAVKAAVLKTARRILPADVYLDFVDYIEIARLRREDELLALREQNAAFMRWFGDSKVVDENGEPLVVYHGTAQGGFEEFDTYGAKYGLMGQGAYFTESPSVASEYTGKNILRMRRAGQDAQTVYPVFLSIKNAIDMDAAPDIAAWVKAYDEYVYARDFDGVKTNEEAYRVVEEALSADDMPSADGAEIMQDGLRAMGYDGITHVGGGRVDPNDVRHRVWIVFDPTQIKSAIGNRGTFDPADPRITYALRPRRLQTESEKSAMLAAEQEGVSDDRSAEDRAIAGGEGGEVSEGQLPESGIAGLREGIQTPGDGDADAGLRNRALDRIIRQESASLDADGNVYVGRRSTKDGSAGKGRARQSAQRVGTVEPFRIGKYEGRVTAVKPFSRDAEEGNLARLTYEIPLAAELHAVQRFDGAWEIDNVVIGKPRTGLGTQLYNAVEADLGIRMSPSGVLSDDGLAFWQKRSPASVQWHVPATWHGFNFSPAKIEKETVRVKDQMRELAAKGVQKNVEAETDRQNSLKSLRSEFNRLNVLWRELPEEARARKVLDEMFALRRGAANELRTPTEVKVYHGTTKEFDVFDPAKSKFDGDFYFSTDPYLTDRFSGTHLNRLYAANEMPGFVGGGRVIPAFIETKNFKTVDMDGYAWRDDGGERLKAEVDLAKSEGFEGLQATNLRDEGVVADQYVAWTKGTVRSAISDDQLLALRGFYSPAIRAAEDIRQEKGTGEQFWKQITKVPGVRKDELDWMGLEEFLKDKPSITKAEVLEFMRGDGRDLAVTRIYQSGLSQKETGTMTGLSQAGVGNILRRLGVPLREYSGKRGKTPQLSDETFDQISAAYQQGKNYRELRSEFGVSTATIKRALDRANIESRGEHPATIDEAKKDEAVRLYVNEKMATEAISKRLGISVAVISRQLAERGLRRSQSEAMALREARRGSSRYSGIGLPFQSEKTGDWNYASSLFELARMRQLDADPSVSSWEKTKAIIPYGEGRHYNPDLFVEYIDGSSFYEEIKPEALVGREISSDRHAAALAYAKEQGSEFRIVTQDVIGPEGFDGIERLFDGVDQEVKDRVGRSTSALRSRFEKMRASVLEGQPFALRGSRREKIDLDIVNAYQKALARNRQGNKWVFLEDLRDNLSQHSREDVDAALKRLWLERRGGTTAIDLSIQDDQGGLTEGQRAAATRFGSSRQDMISIDDSSPLLDAGSGTGRSLPDDDEAWAMRRGQPEALGRTDPYNFIISLAMRAIEAEAAAKGKTTEAEAVRVLRHEAVEFFKATGFFAPKEWALLEKTARQKGWIETTGVRAAYEDLYAKGMSEAELNQILIKEAIAEQYSEFHLGRKEFSPAITRLFERIRTYLRRVANWMKGQGFQTWEDVFTKIDEGEFKRRFEKAFGSQQEAQQGGVAPIVQAGQLQDARGFTPAPGASGVVVGLAEQLDTLKQALGMTVRQGRLDPGAKRAARAAGGSLGGQFGLATGVTRLAVSNDIDTLAHEGGHHLENRFGLGLDAIKQQFSAELTPLASPGPDALSEGFAEFFRRYVTNPQAAQQKAPGFFNAFEDFLDAEDAPMLQQLQALQQSYDEFLKGDPTEVKIANQTVLKGKDNEFTRMMTDAERSGVLNTIGDRLHWLYFNVIGKNHGWWLATKRMLDLVEKNTGRRIDIKAVDNPNKLLRRISHTTAWAMQDLKRGVALRNRPNGGGRSMHEVLATAFGGTDRGQWNERAVQEFGDYLISRRAIHLYVRHRPAMRHDVQTFVAANPTLQYLLARLPNNTESTLDHAPTLEPLSLHLQSLLDHERRNPQFQRAAGMYYEFNKDVLLFLNEKGLLSNEALANLSQDNDYAPFQRDMSDRELASGSQASRRPGQDAALANKFDVYKAIRGSTRDIINPIQSTVQFVYEMRLRAALNDTLVAMDKLAKAAGPGAGTIFERIPEREAKAYDVRIRDALRQAGRDAGMSDQDIVYMLGNVENQIGQNAVATLFTQQQTSERGERIVWFYEDGKPVPAQLADGSLGQMLFEGFTTMGKRSADMWMKVLALPTQAVRTGVTFSFEFVLRNLFVDALTAPTNSPYALPFVTQASGIGEIMRGGRYQQLYNRYAGMMGGEMTASISDQSIDRDIRALRSQGFQVRRPRNLFEFAKMIFQLGEFSETATRVGIFKKAMESAVADGLSEFDAAAEAAHAALDVMDFSRFGSKTELLRRAIPFWNAATQGMDRYVRSLTAQSDHGSAIRTYLKYRDGKRLTKSERAALGLAAKAWTMTTMVMGGMSAFFYFLGEDDEDLDEIGDRLRATHWRVSLNGTLYLIPKDIKTFLNLPEKTDVQLRLPKPFEIAWFANGIERALDGARKEDAAAFQGYLKDFWEIVQPPDGIPALDIPYGFATGKDLFSGRDIVPFWEKDLERAEQFGPYTTESGRMIGRALNVSPYYVDHIVRGVGASVARDVQTGIDFMVGKGPRPGIEEYPIARRFTYNTARSSKSIQKFYDMYRDREGLNSWFWDTMSSDARSFMAAKTTYKRYLDNDNEAAANEFYERLNDDQKVFAVLGVQFKKSKSKFRNLHPIENASEGVTVANGLMKEIVDGVMLTGKKEERTSLDREEMRFARNELGHIRKGMAQNSLKIIGVPGWNNQPLMDIDKRLQTLKEGAPTVYDELIRRLGKKGFVDFKHLSNVWPEVKSRVLQDREKALLGDLYSGGKVGPGYEPAELEDVE